jgi:hypothetical protein
MFSSASIIKSAISERESGRKVMDGIIHSAMTSEFQRSAIDGLVESAIPSQHAKLETMGKIKPSATKGQPGYRSYPGSGR